MSSIGNPKSDMREADMTPDIVATEPTRPSGGTRFGLLPIVGAVVLFGLGLFFASQFIGVLYGLIFIPSVPLPPNISESRHSSEGHGFDEWLYQSTDDSCQIARYFASNGGRCTYAPSVCDAGFLRENTGSVDQIARCVGDVEFSIFAMRWNAEISTSRSRETPTQFRLTREVFWSGKLPRDRSELSELDDEALSSPTP